MNSNLLSKKILFYNILKFGVLLSILLVIGCTQKKTLANSDIWLNAKWIGTAKSIPKSDILFYKENPTPLFRKDFIVSKKIKKASLFITAAGYYKATLNGKRIGKTT